MPHLAPPSFPGLKSNRAITPFGPSEPRPSKIDSVFDPSSGFFASGASFADLARNPLLDLDVARTLQGFVDRSGGNVPRFLPKKAGSVFGDTTAAFEFHTAQQALRQEFVESEILRRFGPQNATSQSSTVNAQGVRTTVSGQQQSVTPTRAQRDEIAASFQTPLQLILAHKPAGSQTSGAAVVGRSDPTIISGAGTRRRRRLGTQAAPTILTSDSDGTGRRGRGVLGGATLLG